MDDLMRDWLGPLIEYELDHAVNWKRRASSTNGGASEETFSEAPVEQTAVSDKLDHQKFKDLYWDDGSNLCAKVRQSTTDAKAVQLLELPSQSLPYKCSLRDKSTSVRAILSKKAVDGLKHGNNPRELSQLRTGAILTIPEFEIMASPFGDTTQRVKLLIKKVEISSNHGRSTLDTPRPVETRARVVSLLTELAELKRGREVSTASGTEIDHDDESQRISSNDPLRSGWGTQNRRHSQEFATQVHYPRVSRLDDDVTLITGLNLSPPVLPSPNDASRSIGTKPLLRKKVVNPSSELLQLLPQNNIINRTVHARAHSSSPTPPDAKQSDTEHGARVEDSSTATDGATFNSPEEDSTVDQGQGISIEPQTNTDIRSALHDINEDGVEEVQDVKTVASPDSDTSDERARIHSRRASTGTADAADAIKLLGDSPSESTSDDFLPESKESKSKTVFRPLSSDPWQGIAPILRLHCLVPKEQEAILSRAESWNPPDPGHSFPVPNIPVSLLKRLVKTVPNTVSKGKSNMLAVVESRPGKEDISRDIDMGEASVAAQSPGFDTSHTPSTPISADSDSEDEAIPWSLSPAMACTTQYPPDTPVKKSLRKQDVGPAKVSPTTPQIGAAEVMDLDNPHGTGRTSELFSTAVQPYKTPKLDIPNANARFESALQPNSLSDANFTESRNQTGVHTSARGNKHSPASQLASPEVHISKNTASQSRPLSQWSPRHVKESPRGVNPGPSPPMDSTQPIAPSSSPPTSQLGKLGIPKRKLSSGQGSTPNHRLVPSTFDPSALRNMRLVNAGRMDGAADGDIPSDQAAAMAEQQLHNEMEASARKIPQSSPVKGTSPPRIVGHSPNRERLKSSPLIVQRPASMNLENRKKRRDHPTDSLESRRKRQAAPISRFQLSQDTQVSQDPARMVAKSRKEFLSKMKQVERPQTSPLAKERQEQSSHSPDKWIPSTIKVNMLSNSQLQVSPEQDPDLSSSPPESLIQSTALSAPNYPALNGNVSPSETAPSGTVNISDPPAAIITSESLFKDFTSAYPNYNGDIKHFMNICRMIQRLVREGRAVHRSICDDFIARHKSDYRPYTLECVENGDDLMPYELFYHERIDEPEHKKRVVTPDKLRALLGMEAEEYAPLRFYPHVNYGFNDHRLRQTPFVEHAAPLTHRPSPRKNDYRQRSPSPQRNPAYRRRSRSPKWRNENHPHAFGATDTYRPNQGRINARQRSPPLPSSRADGSTQQLRGATALEREQPEIPQGPRAERQKNPWKSKERAEEGGEWWRDPKTPFNDMASKLSQMKTVQMEREQAKEATGGKINVLKWEL